MHITVVFTKSAIGAKSSPEISVKFPLPTGWSEAEAFSEISRIDFFLNTQYMIFLVSSSELSRTMTKHHSV